MNDIQASAELPTDVRSTADNFVPIAMDTQRLAAVEADKNSRVGVIDIGSNSVRLVIYDGAGRSPSYFFNEKTLCGLGNQLDESGQLHPAGRAKALEALRRFRSFCDTLQVPVLEAIATAAVREASDGPEFVQQVAQETDIQVHVASGQDEARLAACGVLLGAPRAKGLVADLGGASMEVAKIANGSVGECASLPIGPLRMRDHELAPADLKQKIDTALKECGLLIGKHRRVYAVGGSWRALAKIQMRRTNYPLPILQEYALEREEARILAKWILAQGPEDLERFSDASAARLAVIPYGALVLDRLVKRVRPKQVVLSAFGLREGVYYQHLSAQWRREDPLLSVCRDFEQSRARWPGYGTELYAWLRPLFADSDPDVLRLIEAACLANDIEWRGHPSFQAPVAFETMMRVNVSGVDHKERMFVASVLYFRHAAADHDRGNLPGMSLLKARTMQQAAILGQAMRLAARLSGAAPGVLPWCTLHLTQSTLRLELAARFAVRKSGTVVREFEELARLLKRRAVIKTSAGNAGRHGPTGAVGPVKP